MKKKVCILTSAHYVFDTRIFHKQAKTLAKEGYAVTLIARNEKNEIVNLVKIVALPKAKNRIHRIFWLVPKAFRLALKQKADIYHFHDPELLPIGVFLKLLTGKRVIYDVHEDYNKQILSKPYFPKITRKGVAFLVKMVEYCSCKFFDGIVTATDDISKNFLYHKNVVNVRNFPIISYFFDIKKNYKSEKDVFNLVYIGNLDEIRGIVHMVQALEFINSSRKVKLTLCGNFLQEEYEAKVRNLKGFEKVNYCSFIEHEKIPELLKGSDVGIVCLHPIANYLTALPIKMFEYMAASLPVIASNFPLWKEIVEVNRCGICVDPLNIEKIAKAIEYFIEQPELIKEMGENGRRMVLEKHNWEKESKKLLKLYKEI